MRLEPGEGHDCSVCGVPIGGLALSIIDDSGADRADDTHRHLVCCVDHHRHDVHAALTQRDIPAALLALALDELAVLDVALAAEVTAFRDTHYPATVVRTTNLDDPRTRELLALLEAAPEDRALYEVLADHLQLIGDERGELIALDLAAPADLASADLADLVAATRRRELAHALAPPLPPPLPWRYGFLHKLELVVRRSLDEHRDLLAHPACRLLQSLDIAVRKSLEVPPGWLPRSLRELRVYGELIAPLAELPYLARLEVSATDGLAHPTLRSLELVGPTAAQLGRAAIDFPAVTTLGIAYGPRGTVGMLDEIGWLDRLEALALRHVTLSARDARRLEQYPHLELRIIEGGSHAQRLEELRRPPPPPPRIVTHATRPEWGEGTIVREYDGKVDVAFTTGTKTFRADAPFLVPVEP